MIRKLLLVGVLYSTYLTCNAQTTVLHGTYKAVTIAMDANVPYSKTLILLHEIYDGVNPLPNNYVVGTIMALRGATGSVHRQDVVHINSGSAYSSATRASLSSYNISKDWTLKTCIYNGKHYLALDVPYTPQQYSQGYHFAGWVNSSGESLKTVTYEINGVPQNQTLLSNVQDFVANMSAQQQVGQLTITGNVGIGTTNPQAKLAVNGNILAKEIKIKTDISVPDYVFEEDYKLPELADVEAYIRKHKHLPEIPSAADIQQDGLDLSEMNLLLLKKVEELTLHLIKKEQTQESMQKRLDKQERLLLEIADKLEQN